MAPSSAQPTKTARPVATALVALERVQVAARSTNKFAATTQALCDLAAKGDLKSLTRFLEVTPRIEQAIDGEALVEALGEVLTPLGAGVGSGDGDIVAALLAQGASPNQQAGPRQLAPLHLAVSGGCRPHHPTVELPNEGKEITARLLAANADASVRTSDGASPLHYACATGELDCAELLLDTESCRHSLGFLAEGMRPLTIAALKGNIPLVELLLGAGANPDGLEVLRTGETVSELEASAAQQEYDEVLQEQRSSKKQGLGAQGLGAGAATPGAGQASGRIAEADVWPLYVACRYGHDAIVQMLLEANATPNAERRDGSTALHPAAGHGHDACVQLLLAAGAGVKSWNVLGVGPLFAACVEGEHVGVVKLLLDANAPVDGSDSGVPTKLTPLMGAATEGHPKVLELLLAGGANVYAQSYDGKTALDLAMRHTSSPPHEACVALLETAMSEEGGAPVPPGLNRTPSRAQIHQKAEEVRNADAVAHPPPLSPARPRSRERSQLERSTSRDGRGLGGMGTSSRSSGRIGAGSPRKAVAFANDA